MKTNVSVYVDDRKKTGKCPVYIKVSRGRNERFLVNTGLVAITKFEGRQFPKSEPGCTAKTNRLNSIFSQVEEYCIRNVDMPMKDLKNALQAVISGRTVNCKPFVEYCRRYAENCPTKGTAGLYEQTARKVESYNRDATFDTMTLQWLKGFERYCSRTMSINGMGIVFRNIRAVFNQARKDGVTDKYPFANYTIKKEETRKRSLTPDQIRRIRDLECRNEQIAEYRDMWMLVFYLIGINAKDLFTARKEQLVNGRLEYRRAKTGKLYSIKVEPEAMAIIDRYRGKGAYLLNIMDRYANYSDYLHHMNNALHRLGMAYIEGLGYDRDTEPIDSGLSTYYARHSWATVAADRDVSYDVISAALGHSIANPTTAIYINFNQKKVDDANRKVIDYINGEKSRQKKRKEKVTQKE